MSRSKKVDRVLLVGLCLLVLAVYRNVGSFGFIEESDDTPYVLANPQVRGGLTSHGVAWAFTAVGYAANWHPLTWLSHMLDVELFGLKAGGHHLVSVLLHCASTAIFFLVLRNMTGLAWRSALAAALFGIHPLNVESVAWVAERKNVLSGLFWMLSLAAYLHYRRRPRIGRYGLVFLAMAGGLLAKPMLVTVPFVLLLLDYWPLGLFTADARGKRSGPQHLVLEKLPLLLLAVGSSWITMRAQAAGASLTTLDKLPVDTRIANALVSYLKYVVMTAWPADLSSFYPYARESLFSGSTILAAMILALVTTLTVWKAREYPYLVTGWCWFLGTLVPVIGLVQVGDQALADRYAYLTVIGLFLAASWGVPTLFGRRPLARKVLAIGAFGSIVALSAAATAQVRYWGDGALLFRQAIEHAPDNWVAHNNLGVYLRKRGRDDEAFEHFARAVAARPSLADAQYNLGVLLYERGRMEEAAEHYRSAIRFRPDYEEAHCNLGAILFRQGRLDEAAGHFREAVRLRPEDQVARDNLATVLRQRP
jgi:hypothetical protein